MIADLIRLSALYVLVRVFVEIAMPSSRLIVKYLFWAGIALTVVGTMGPQIKQATTDLHAVATTYTDGKNMVNGLLGGSKQDNSSPTIGYQGIWERLMGSTKFDWPIKGKVTKEFAGEKHHGIDIVGKVGDKIKTSRPGKVKKIIQDDPIYGLHIIIDHGNGYETLYAHCSKVVVPEGETIFSGDKIAEVGNTGNSTGPHLHFELRINTKTVDPSKYF